ncbi:MAG: SIMPL domain-containing protein [Bdellovibrionales bacterium]|nr:SIMPL domain-containing protein [Bdellovibrionales bacterium]
MMNRTSVSLVLGSLLMCSSSSQAESEVRKVTVSGKCSRNVTPDRGAMVLTAEFRDDDLKTASRRATEAYERTRDAVKKLNLKDLDLKTVEYSMGEVREWEKNKSVFKGYRARMGLRVATSQVDRLGELIAIASREGLKDVGALQSFLSDSKQISEQVGCLQDAAGDARIKAEKLASSLGASLGEVLRISESGGTQDVFSPRMMTFGSRDSEEIKAPTIEAGQQTLNLTVEVSFSLK